MDGGACAFHHGLVRDKPESLSSPEKDNPLSMNTPGSEYFRKINSLLLSRERKDATCKSALPHGATGTGEKSDQHRVAARDPGWVTVEEP
jgi:hypothetical protein